MMRQLKFLALHLKDVIHRDDKLRIERDTPEPKDRAQLIRDVLRALGTPKQALAA